MLFSFGCNNCRKLDCQNGAQCYEGECLCEKWYSGESCDLTFSRNYAGAYYGIIDSADRSYADTISFLSVQDIPNRLLIQTGIYAEFENDSQLIIPTQLLNYNNDTIPVQGFGSVREDLLSIQYSNQYESPRGVFFQFKGRRVISE